jgi:type III restriction enzyme
MLGYIQSKTELTRSTILEILKGSGRLNELLVNPQLFMDNAVVAIRKVLHELMVDGIKYTKIGNSVYEMQEVFRDELETYFTDDVTLRVSDASKTIFENLIPLDSKVENQFARDCESSENIEFYFKLPSNFKIPTPIGNYNPDWALIFKGEKKIYFVAETKGDGQELLGSEKMKIKCGKKHFAEFNEVEYTQVTKVADLTR